MLTITCGSYSAGSPTAVLCSRELVSCGNGETHAVVEWIPAACGFSLHIATLDFFPFAPFFVSCALGGKAKYFPEEF